MRQAGITFTVRAARIDETPVDGEGPEQVVQRLAESKARAVWQPGELVLGADTEVVLDGRVLGKPTDADEARAMLRILSGRRHRVLTGMCLFDGTSVQSAVEETIVQFAAINGGEIDAYVMTGESFDKAGGYGIQGAASKFVERIEGCYFNVVGLPVARLWSMLNAR